MYSSAFAPGAAGSVHPIHISPFVPANRSHRTSTQTAIALLACGHRICYPRQPPVYHLCSGLPLWQRLCDVAVCMCVSHTSSVSQLPCSLRISKQFCRVVMQLAHNPVNAHTRNLHAPSCAPQGRLPVPCRRPTRVDRRVCVCVSQ